MDSKKLVGAHDGFFGFKEPKNQLNTENDFSRHFRFIRFKKATFFLIFM